MFRFRAGLVHGRFSQWTFNFLIWIVASLLVPFSYCHAQHDDFFENKIRPLLVDNCLECHSSENQESEFSLETIEGLLRGGENGKAVTGKDPDSSLLYKVLSYEGDIKMPPSGKLSAEQIEDIGKWISLGTPWPEGKKISVATMKERVDSSRKSHWSFQSIEAPERDLESDDWCSTTIDRFVSSKLKSAHIAPAVRADRRTLVRRLYFDLLGLPPTPAQAQSFVESESPNAYENLVNQLLASPRYGERWGRHWLDVARYADTKGYAFAQDRNYPFAWTYRDYVIRSFNEDLPYDRFIVEQIAADFLDTQKDSRSLAGLGFLTVGRKFNNFHDDIDDKIDAVTRGFLGLTVSCARCHDHKYDAIPTADYYSLYGVFASTQESTNLPLIGEPNDLAKLNEYKNRLDQANQEINEYKASVVSKIRTHALENLPAYLVAASTTELKKAFEEFPEIKLTPNTIRTGLVSKWRKYILRMSKPDHPSLMPWSVFIAIRGDDFKKKSLPIFEKIESLTDDKINPLVRAAILESRPESLEQFAFVFGKLLHETYEIWREKGASDSVLDKLPQDRRQLALLLFDDLSPTAIKVDNVKAVFERDERDKLKKLESKVNRVKATSPAGFARAMVVEDKKNPHEPVIFIRGNAGQRGKRVPRRYLEVLSESNRPKFVKGSGRLELAQQIASAKNPLTARVLANRIWMHHFGQSIVETPSDLGIRCPEPVHSGLLEYLAWHLIKSEWSIKSLHKEILLSSTYRQSSKASLETMEKDPRNQYFSRFNRRRLEFEPLRDSILAISGNLNLEMEGRAIDIFKKTETTRRTVYSKIDRQDLPNLLRAFNFASPDQSQAKRPNTIVPQQSLFLMNSEFVQTQASIFAKSASEIPSDEVIHFMYQEIFQRLPSEKENRIAKAFLGNSKEKLPQLAQLLFLTNEFSYID